MCLAFALLSVMITISPPPVHAAIPPTRARLSHLTWGQNASFVLDDSTAITGQYLGLLGSVSSAEYPSRYEQWRAAAAAAASLPALESTMEVTTITGDTLRGTLIGICSGLMVVRPEGSRLPHAVLFSRVDRIRAREGAEWLDAAGGELWGGAPALEVVALRVSRDTLMIPLGRLRGSPTADERASADTREAAQAAVGVAAFPLLLIGAAALMVAIVASMNPFKP